MGVKQALRDAEHTQKKLPGMRLLTPAAWFVMTATTLWALGLDPVTAARWAFLPAAAFMCLITSAMWALALMMCGLTLLAPDEDEKP